MSTRAPCSAPPVFSSVTVPTMLLASCASANVEDTNRRLAATATSTRPRDGGPGEGLKILWKNCKQLFIGIVSAFSRTLQVHGWISE